MFKQNKFANQEELKSWWEAELAEKKAILNAFWELRILPRHLEAINEFKRFIIERHFPPDKSWEDKIEKIFSDAIEQKCKFDTLFDELKNIPLSTIRAMNNAEKLVPSANEESFEPKNTIEKYDMLNLKRYMKEKNVSSGIAMGLAGDTNPQHCTEQAELAFAMHSIGKVFTGILALIMIRKNIFETEDLKKSIQLDPAILATFPEAMQEQLKKVSLHQVMTHHAGFSDYLGEYISAIEKGIKNNNVPGMKRIEDFIPFCQESYYLKAIAEEPKDISRQEQHGYLLIKTENTWRLVYIDEQCKKNEIKITDINGLQDALNNLPNKSVEKLSKEDLSPVYNLLTSHFCDHAIGQFRYSNVGILLVGLAIQHAYEKKYGKFEYNDILQNMIIDVVNMPSFSPWCPEKDVKFNREDEVAPHIAGSPAGGYWVNAVDLAKFGLWIYNECAKDEKLKTLLEEYGQEFYNKDNKILSHSGGIQSSSAFLYASFKTGFIYAILSDQPDMAFDLNIMLQEHIFSKQKELPEMKHNKYE